MKRLECVVLLRGNFVVVPITDDKKNDLSQVLHECNKKSVNDPSVYLKWGEDITILAKEVVGWYFRAPMESSTDKLMKFIDKKIPGDEGDGWKGTE
jgi:hypothetical protein